MSSPSTTTAMETPLAGAHRAAGAKMGVWFGCALPDSFGDWQAEYRFARESVALLDKNYRAYLSFTGADRVRYLNAILTNNIRDLSPGQGIVSLLLNPQGHILAEVEGYAFPENLFGVSHAMIREPLIAALDKYIIMDDVTIADETERYGTLALEGPKAAEVVRALCAVELATISELGHVETRTKSSLIPFRLVRRSPGGISGAEFLVERSHLLSLWRELLESAHAMGGGPLGYTALNALRIEQNVPWFGYDFGEKQIPHEAGLQESHISYTKGCYTGQEIVERVRSRGHVNRSRVRMQIAGEAPPPSGTPILANEKEAGHVTRAAFSPASGAVIAFGHLRREFVSSGTPLSALGHAVKILE